MQEKDQARSKKEKEECLEKYKDSSYGSIICLNTSRFYNSFTGHLAICMGTPLPTSRPLFPERPTYDAPSYDPSRERLDRELCEVAGGSYIYGIKSCW